MNGTANSIQAIYGATTRALGIVNNAVTTALNPTAVTTLVGRNLNT
jgi:hypothetical protein